MSVISTTLRILTFLVLMEGVSLAINVIQCFSFPMYAASYMVYRSYIRITEQLFGSLMVILTYLLCPVELVITGDHQALSADERLIILANHQTLVDWWYLWLLAWWKGAHGDVRIVLKSSLKWIPIMGWGMQFFEFIFLNRKISMDASILTASMRKIRSTASLSLPPYTPTPKYTGLPLWLILFPEGTVYTLDTIEKSTAYADRVNMPPHLRPKHTILPRSTGLKICFDELMHGADEGAASKKVDGAPCFVDSLHDITMGFEGANGERGKGTPDDVAYDRFGLTEVFFGGKGPRRVHLHVRTVSLADVPNPKAGVVEGKGDAFDEWLLGLYREKDTLMDGFYQEGKFPDKGKRVEVVKVVPGLVDVGSLIATLFVAWKVVGIVWPVLVKLVWG
ncbi:hypothetical protein HDU97_006998 [Phlyctochytrium planicorne]|nr:hypothetical protein HDU97_006998 [Phlyctochytrium planicorne]